MTPRKEKPLMRQFMVSATVSLSMMEHSLVAGYTSVLLSQLRGLPIFHLDDVAASWIASITPLANTIGILCVPPLIGKYGRRSANLISAILMASGWLSIVLATNLTTILIAKFLQGVGLGITSLNSAVLIAEYTTPKYRGAFLTMMCFALLSGALVIHTLGSILTWTQTAVFCFSIAIVDFILILSSPESPMFLLTCGKYDDCRKVFHWLRGFDDEEELEDMIKAEVLTRATEKKCTTNMTEKMNNVLHTLKKSEFYKPLIIMIHLDIILCWSGTMTMDVYGMDIFKILMGEHVNVPLMLITMDIVRILSTILAIFLNVKVNRRLMIVIFTTLNVLVYFAIAIYSYAKVHWLVYDHQSIGAILVYSLMFTIGAGTTPIVNIIGGEIFPLKYKHITVMIDTLFKSLNFAIKLKTFPQLISSLGLHGACTIYGLLMLYAMLVARPVLPETKDLTLQNIEELYWTKKKLAEETTTEELHDLI